MTKKKKVDKISWTTLSIPKKILDDVKEIIKLEEFDGQYTSTSDFIRETIRLRIQEINALRKANEKHIDEFKK